MSAFLLQSDPVTLIEKRAVRLASMMGDGTDISITSASLDGLASVPPDRHAIPVGTVEFCRAWMDHCGIREPEPTDYPESLKPFLGRNVSRLASYGAAPDGAWVKPVKTKAWDAHIKGAGLPHPDGEVWVSDPLHMLAEWRVYVRDGRVLGDGRYDDGEDDSLEMCRDTVASMIAAFNESGEAPCAYALDVALTHDGETILVEVTDAWAIGYYRGSCSQSDYAGMLDARWNEMQGSGELVEPTVEQIGEVLTALVNRGDMELLALSDAGVAGQWYWRWEEGRSVEWNTYKFSDALEMHKRRCRRWEEHHNGSACVVERVRDKYVMPRVREFLAALGVHTGTRRAF